MRLPEVQSLLCVTPGSTTGPSTMRAHKRIVFFSSQPAAGFSARQPAGRTAEVPPVDQPWALPYLSIIGKLRLRK